MLQQRIEQYFDQFPTLHVLFFFDEEKEHEDAFNTMELQGIRKVKYDQRNFYLKVMLQTDWASDKVFLYFQQPVPASQNDYLNFPLLDQLVANKVLYLDNVSDFMERFQLAPNQRTLAKRYKNELKYASIEKVLMPILNRNHFQEPELVKGLYSAFLKFTKIENWDNILVKMLTLANPGQEEELDRFLKKITDNQLHSFIAQPVKEYLNVDVDFINLPLLIELRNKLKYNLITMSLEVKPDDPYKELKIRGSQVLSMLSILSETAQNNPRLAEPFRNILENPNSQIKDETLLQVYGINADFVYLTNIMKWKILANGTASIDTNPNGALQVFERVLLFSDNNGQLKSTLSFLSYLAQLISQINSLKGYIFDTPDEYIEKYSSEFYRIDQSYRLAIVHFRQLDQNLVSEYLPIDTFKDLLENRYETYLEKLNREWLKCFSEHGFNYKKLQVPKQYEFYIKEIKPYTQKIVVIVSDALRYEAAASLLAELHSDSKNEAVLRLQLASIPSTTQFGMANLLAEKNIAYNEGTIYVDGISSEGLANRSKILNNRVPEARAVSFSEVVGNSQQANRDVFKSPLVYIFHDSIDAVGDKRSSERNTFKAVAEAINELADMVKKVHSSFNVARVLITSDHGFIYNDQTIKEADKEPLNEAEALQTHNRYAIIKSDKKHEFGYKIPLKETTTIESDLFVLVPNAVNRYKKQGVGHQFVHGGTSLQEIIVPIIESSRKVKKVSRKVNPVLLTQNPRVVSSILRLQILQDQKVSKDEKDREIIVGLYNDLELVSNQASLHLNSTSELPSERSFKCELMLRGDAGKTSVLKLKIYDKDDMLNPIYMKDVLNNTLIEPEF